MATDSQLKKVLLSSQEERRMPVPGHEAISPGSLVVAVQRREALA
jgi:hypothetical protein